jgi:hypothetical protein
MVINPLVVSAIIDIPVCIANNNQAHPKMSNKLPIIPVIGSFKNPVEGNNSWVTYVPVSITSPVFR